MKTEAISTVFAKIAAGIATAVAIGGGTAIIHDSATNAVQDQRIFQLEADRAAMHELSAKLDATDKNVAVLNARLDQVLNRRE